SVEPEVAFIVDVDHHHADLVDVAGEHQPARTGAAIAGGEGSVGVAVHVDGDVICDCRRLAPDPGGRGLEAGGPWRVEQAGQELELVVGHPWKVSCAHLCDD